MKRIGVIVFMMMLGISYGVHAQDKKAQSSAATFVSPTATLSKIYTQDELEKLSKLEIRNIYIERFIIVTEIMPYLSLHTKPGASLGEMGIPEKKENIDHLNSAIKAKKSYIDAVKATLDDVIPYSDTKNIIWAILFFQETIQKAQEGSNN